MERKSINAKTDLTEGPITAKLLSFALPIIAGNIIMQLYNVADSIIVGRYVGSHALAAVAVSFPIMMLFNSIFMGLAMGANILIAQFRGAGNTESLEKSINTTFSLSFLVGSAITLFGLVLSKPLLQLLGTPDDIIGDSSLYLAIVFAGTIGNIGYSLCNGIVRGLGDSKWPLYALIISSVMNVALDLLFVIVFGWGVPGVAIATTLSHIFAGIVLLLRFVQGKYGVKISISQMKKIDGHITGLILKLGLPSTIQNSAMSLGNIVVQGFSNNFGTNYIAANSIVNRVDGFAMMPMFGIGMAITTFVGQNIGAGNVERSRQGINKAIEISIGIAVVMGFLIYNFGSYLILAFTDNQEVMAMGMRGLKFLAFCFVFMGINQCLGGAMRGAGAATAPAVIAILGSVIRIPAAYYLAMIPFNRDISNAVTAGLYATADLAKAAGEGLSNYMGLFYTMGISMFSGALMMFAYYKFGNWHTKGVTDKAKKVSGKESMQEG